MDFYCFLNFFTRKLYRFPHKNGLNFMLWKFVQQRLRTHYCYIIVTSCTGQLSHPPWVSTTKSWGGKQGRNFGLKSGGTNSGVGEHGSGRCFPSHSTRVVGSIMRSPSGVHGTPAEDGFSVISSLQIASVDSKFFNYVLKSGGTVPPVQNVQSDGALVPP